MKIIRILILEDDLETLSVLLNKLHKLEEELLKSNKSIAVTVFSEYTQINDYLNKISSPNFDVILLDRDTVEGGSFHALDMAKFGLDKILSISSIPQYNEEARRLGVVNSVHKDYKELNNFSGEVMVLINKIVDEKSEP